MEEFIRDQDYEKAHDSLLAVDPRRVGPLIRTEREQNLMRQHVRNGPPNTSDWHSLVLLLDSFSQLVLFVYF